MGIKLVNDIGYTSASVEFFERYKEAFGNVINVRMISDQEKGDYKLVLVNEKEEELRFEGGLASGYRGEGCSGTYRVLKMCGFDITRDFIEKNPSFELKK